MRCLGPLSLPLLESFYLAQEPPAWDATRRLVTLRGRSVDRLHGGAQFELLGVNDVAGPSDTGEDAGLPVLQSPQRGRMVASGGS